VFFLLCIASGYRRLCFAHRASCGPFRGCASHIPPGATLAAAGDARCSLASSPSGYGCDPWSAHLYFIRGIARNGNTLRLTVVHDPDYEGNANDIKIPPGHDYFQQLTVDVAFTTAIRDFVCVVFSSAPGDAGLDASSPRFLTEVENHPESSLLAGPILDGTAHVNNIAAVCGTSHLTAVRAPHLVTTGKPVLADLALAVPLTPKPQGFVVGTKFSAWVARGFLYVDEESELSPPGMARVTPVK
jgi:hypothetical protein